MVKAAELCVGPAAAVVVVQTITMCTVFLQAPMLLIDCIIYLIVLFILVAA